jgi:hypothetical protein
MPLPLTLSSTMLRALLTLIKALNLESSLLRVSSIFSVLNHRSKSTLLIRAVL